LETSGKECRGTTRHVEDPSSLKIDNAGSKQGLVIVGTQKKEYCYPLQEEDVPWLDIHIQPPILLNASLSKL
jgi:hypothetical protein